MSDPNQSNEVFEEHTTVVEKTTYAMNYPSYACAVKNTTVPPTPAPTPTVTPTVTPTERRSFELLPKTNTPDQEDVFPDQVNTEVTTTERPPRPHYAVVLFVKYGLDGSIPRPSLDDVNDFFGNFGEIDHLTYPENKDFVFVFMKSLNTTAAYQKTRTVIADIIHTMTPETRFYVSVANSRRNTPSQSGPDTEPRNTRSYNQTRTHQINGDDNQRHTRPRPTQSSVNDNHRPWTRVNKTGGHDNQRNPRPHHPSTRNPPDERTVFGNPQKAQSHRGSGQQPRTNNQQTTNGNNSYFGQRQNTQSNRGQPSGEGRRVGPQNANSSLQSPSQQVDNNTHTPNQQSTL